MIRIDNVTLSKNSVYVQEQVKIEVSVTEIFPTWEATKPHVWDVFKSKTWGVLKGILTRERGN